MRSIIAYINESEEQINDIVSFIKTNLANKSDSEISSITRKLKGIFANENESNELLKYLSKEKGFNSTDVKLINECIIDSFDLDDENLYKFFTSSKFNLSDVNETYDIFDVIDSQCKSLSIDDTDFKNNLKKLFINLGKLTPNRVGAYEYALRVIFSNVKNVTTQDIKVDDNVVELKSDIFAVKSAGAKSAKSCEEKFLEILYDNDIPDDKKFKSAMFVKTKNGIFSSGRKMKEFNDYLQTNGVSKEKMKKALAAVVKERCGVDNIDDIIDGVITDDGLLKIREIDKNGNVLNKNINEDKLVEKLLLCCDFYNLIVGSEHKNMLIFETKKYKDISKGCKCLYLDFNDKNSFKDIWEKIHIIPSGDKHDYWFVISALWGYDPNETSSLIEQVLVCAVQLKVK